MQNYFLDNRNPAMLKGEPEPILDGSGQAQVGWQGKAEGTSGTSKGATVHVEGAPGTAKVSEGQAEGGQGTKSPEQADQPCFSAQCFPYDAAAESVELPALAERAQPQAQAQNAPPDEDQPAPGSSGRPRSPRPCTRVTPCTYGPALYIKEKETMQPIVDLMKLD
ncbi:unnamed protein product [Bursaphelenchus okinawaensis]|uniref:Uncharacterized protein n=1 Tax=Bursaphelenchus okinawaensis TaxID=465554 RepID=A0A811KUA6_9BILA|nr:unnamed protein product [Bursaphelenchus okinawaensis]CAG9110545.1 unnamed protein product [Bursaphelenchus okinawaensis]